MPNGSGTPDRVEEGCPAHRGSGKGLAGFPLAISLSRSTAGPGAGSASIVLGFEGTRVKAISAEEGDFELLRRGDRYSILHEAGPGRGGGAATYAASLSEQAFFNGTASILRVLHSPHLDERITKSLDADKIVRLIMEAERGAASRQWR